jgi:hypothetical protein
MSEGLAKFFEWLPTDPHYETQEMERALLSETNPLQEPTVFLDERSFKEGTQRSRSYREPLTAQGLYNALKKPVRYLNLSFINKGCKSYDISTSASRSASEMMNDDLCT